MRQRRESAQALAARRRDFPARFDERDAHLVCNSLSGRDRLGILPRTEGVAIESDRGAALRVDLRRVDPYNEWGWRDVAECAAQEHQVRFEGLPR